MQEAYTTNILAARTTAPGFTLSVTPDQKLSLRNLRGRPARGCDPARLAPRAPAVRS